MQFLSVLKADLLQRDLNTHENSKPPCINTGVIIEIGKPMNEVNPEKLKNIFNTIAQLYIWFAAI